MYGTGYSGQAGRGNTQTRGIESHSGTKCYYCGKEGHWKNDCYKRKSDETGKQHEGYGGSQEFTFLAEKAELNLTSGWIVDSGASQHYCGDRRAFSCYSYISKDQAITIADRKKIKATGIGEIPIPTVTGSIKLTNVWHVPGIGGNLLSVSRMVDASYRVEFGARICTVSKNRVRTLLGQRFGSLYYLNNGLEVQSE